MEILVFAFGLLLIGAFAFGAICVIRETVLKGKIKKNMQGNLELAHRMLSDWSARCTPMQLACEIRLNQYASAWNELLLPGILTELYASGTVLFDTPQNRIGFREDTAEPDYRRTVLKILRSSAAQVAARTGSLPVQEDAWTWVPYQSFLNTVFPYSLDMNSGALQEISGVMEQEVQRIRQTDPNFRRDMEFIRHTFELQYKNAFVPMENVLQTAGGGKVDPFRLLLFLNLSSPKQLEGQPGTMFNVLTGMCLRYNEKHTETMAD